MALEPNFKGSCLKHTNNLTLELHILCSFESYSINFWTTFCYSEILKKYLDIEFEGIYLPPPLVMRKHSRL
jgi:hypothetical protein